MASRLVDRNGAEAGVKELKLLLLLPRRPSKSDSRPALLYVALLLDPCVSVSLYVRESGLTTPEIKHHLSSLTS